MVDLLPEQTRCWQAVEAVARDHFRRAGVEEIRTPLLEVTDLFSRGIGEGTDVVGKEMYSFLDRGERSCTLRQNKNYVPQQKRGGGRPPSRPVRPLPPNG